MPTTHFTSTWFFKWNPPGDNTPSPPQVLHSLAPVSPHHAHGSFDAEPSSRRLGKAFNGSSRFGEFGFEDGDRHRAVTRHDLGILGMRMGITPQRHFVLSRETDDDDARATHDTPHEPRGVLSPKSGYAICGAYDCVRKESGVFRAYVFSPYFLRPICRLVEMSNEKFRTDRQTDSLSANGTFNLKPVLLNTSSRARLEAARRAADAHGRFGHGLAAGGARVSCRGADTQDRGETSDGASDIISFYFTA